MTVVLNITREDIQNGTIGNCLKCPLKRAFDRACPGRRSFVTRHSISVQGGVGESFQNIPHPEHVVDRIFRYDTTGVMDPFSYPIDID